MKRLFLLVVLCGAIISIVSGENNVVADTTLTQAQLDSIANKHRLDSIAYVHWKDSMDIVRAERDRIWQIECDSVRNEDFQHQGRYKLYPTKNTWNFLKLDTETGKIWQVQYSVEGPTYRFTTDLDLYEKLGLCDAQIPGRFELYPTTNTYNFILLDKINGRCWQVQWSFDRDERMCIRIY